MQCKRIQMQRVTARRMTVSIAPANLVDCLINYTHKFKYSATMTMPNSESSIFSHSNRICLFSFSSCVRHWKFPQWKCSLDSKVECSVHSYLLSLLMIWIYDLWVIIHFFNGCFCFNFTIIPILDECIAHRVESSKLISVAANFLHNLNG